MHLFNIIMLSEDSKGLYVFFHVHIGNENIYLNAEDNIHNY